MRRPRHAALLLAAAGLVPAVAGQAAPRTRAPVTLAKVASGVVALTQSGQRVAWVDSCGPVLMAGSRTTRIGPPLSPRPANCYAGITSTLSLAGARTLWAADFGGNHREIAVMTQSSGSPRVRTLERELSDTSSAEEGRVFGGVASDGSRLAYATGAFLVADRGGLLGAYCDFYFLPCRVTSLPGKTVLVDASGRAISRAGGGTSIALGSGRVATATTIPAQGPCTCGATPAWSPDSSSLVFAGGWTSDGTSLYVESARGGALRRLTTRDDVIDAEPDWSPDGSRIVFARESLPRALSGRGSAVEPEIDVVPAGGGPTKRLALGRDPAWSPDGSRIAFVRSAGLYTMNASGGAQKLVAAGDDMWSPTWSPDGTRLAVVTSTNGSLEGTIALVGSGGGTARPLVGGPKEVAAVRWTHDGKQLLAWTMGSAKVEASEIVGYDFASRTIEQVADGDYVGVARDGKLVYLDPALRVLHVMGTDRVDIRQLPLPKPTRSYPIELRRSGDGSRLASIDAGAPVSGLALGRSFVAARLPHRIAVFALPGGTLRASIPLKRAPSPFAREWIPSMSASGSLLVFSDGLRIGLFDAATGRTTTLANAHTPPVGLSISGRRVVWAEDTRSKFGDLTGPGRVLSLQVG